MKGDPRAYIATAAEVVEIALGILILLGCIIAGVGVVCQADFGAIFADPLYLQEKISEIYVILIGVELIKMITSHTVNSVVDVMLVAVARQMIAEHTSPLENIMAVVAVAILFTIRKYLYISHLDNRHRKKEKKPETEQTQAAVQEKTEEQR